MGNSNGTDLIDHQGYDWLKDHPEHDRFVGLTNVRGREHPLYFPSSAFCCVLHSFFITQMNDN
jgi:hypothetical protein